MIINKDNINWGKIQEGVEKYIWIMNFIEKAKLKNYDLSKESEFRKKFNGFLKNKTKT